MRLWDRDPLLQTFGQLQEIRTYYDFVSVDDDRYWIDGKYRQVLLSPRELNTASLPTRTFINEHLTFTHGMGLTLGPVNQVTPEGLPVLFIKDLPPVSHVSLKVTRPQIYYGELANEFVFVRHPAAGVRPSLGRGERLRRVHRHAAACRVGNLAAPAAARRPVRLVQDPLLAGHHRRQPGALLPEHRRAGEEGAAVPPVRSRSLHGDRGRRHAASGSSTPTPPRTAIPTRSGCRDGTNYMRNSVKLVIDAYDGVAHGLCQRAGRPDDPDLGPDLPGHLRCRSTACRPTCARTSAIPDDIYRIQTGLYATYHMDAPEDFYHREDQWQIPAVAEAAGERCRSCGTSSCACRRSEGRVHLHGAVHAAGEGQPGGVDGGAERRRRIREAPGVPALPAEPGVRSPADREPDQPGHRDLAPDLALGPARLAR